MTDSSSSTLTNQAQLQMDLFRPALSYPVHPYDEILTQAAQRFPEQSALLFQEVDISYRELDALVNTFANALRHLGIHKGQTVCLFMTNRPEYIISWFAIIRIGAVVSPMNPSYKEREVSYQLSNSDAVAIIVQSDLLPLVEAGRSAALEHVILVGCASSTHGHVFSDLVNAHPSTPPVRADWAWDDLITLPYSSGTTGLPKGVMLSQKNLVYNGYQSVSTARITSHDRMLIFLPLYHIYGIMLIGTATLSGATIVLMERFDATRSLQYIHEQKITLLYAVPQVLPLLGEHAQLDKYDLQSVRYVQCGAAPVPPTLAHRFEERTHITVMTSYGLTEASPGTHSNPVFNPRLIKVETIGLPIHDTKQKIVDIETGQRELGVGEEGELLVQGPQVMLGYWKAPEATAEAIRDGWLHTGDIGWRDEEGYVTITDRKKELIKYKGFSVAPAQIEALLLEHPAVADAAVISKAHAEAGEVPKAFVVLRAGYEDQSADALMAWSNEQLATYKHIHDLEFTDTIPRTPSGKILRRLLKERERQQTDL